MATRALATHSRNALLNIVFSVLLGSAPALAAPGALVNIDLNVRCCGIATAFDYSWPSESITVSTHAPGASFMVRSRQLTVHTTSYYSGPFTPTGTRVVAAYNLAGTLMPSNPTAPAAPTTVHPPTSTTLCTDTPVTGGSCQPRYGFMKVAPGGNKFGGTMRMINRGQGKAIFRARGEFYYFYYNNNPTPRLRGKMSVGGYGIVGTGRYTHTLLTSIMFVTSFQETGGGPYTTGMAYVYQTGGQYATMYTTTGYDNRTATANGEITGTVSLVRPRMWQIFQRDTFSDPVTAARIPFGFANRLTITFLPEPGTLLALGCGLLAVGVFYRFRRP
jgi:hypothetical protein